MFKQAQGKRCKEKLKPQSTTYGLKIFAAEGLFFFSDWTELQIKALSFLKGGLNWCEKTCSSGACILAAGWRNKLCTYEKEGMYWTFFFPISAPISVTHLWYHRHHPVVHGQGQAWKGAWLSGEGFSWGKVFRGKILPAVSLCVTQEVCDFSCQHWSSLAAQVRAWLGAVALLSAAAGMTVRERTKSPC